ncbi:MAG: glutamate synthase [Deltaproteobacteria bacterium RIFCSPLOWO2_02_FULL_50_16]|nr:MAG: glutamate synthase [Deltaproteobacteria bacterium GWA2_50_8]OGQ32506.1 MAG: glutamate synthase [Deltaproteobacteria bacterium RIFCSPHIGHO2_02_FULL_50_15]OGQ58550.1 MAG: glutamate synthase [Deltaproteobacteria bacterium RIFCSPLOWO2_02_FULL_50_16]OGQ67352.1 MAG: glutamate synthase [Deltaproteobacteria bacterium RIFCSPLOWO2_12_FULL_50_11]
MGKLTGFLEYKRAIPEEEPVGQRVQHYQEFTKPLPEEKLMEQGARCMDCGVPFCQSGCPLGNIIPEWNEFVYHSRWAEAIQNLHSTNNFPEFTGRVCPAPCENACVLGLIDQPIAIKQIEKEIIDHALKEGWVKPQPPTHRTGKRVAVIGSGPAGLAAAQQLRRAGHHVVIYEKSDRFGGLLRYGIPDFKLEKRLLDFRIEQMREEGVIFKPNIHVGVDIIGNYLLKDFDATILAIGAGHPRDLDIPGRTLKGVHFAMEYLTQQNRRFAEKNVVFDEEILAKNKTVVVIGGGDTGSDCVGTAHRQGAKKIYQFEILPKPPDERPPSTPWPLWSGELRTSTSHKEGCERRWCISTTRLTGENGAVKKLHGVEVKWEKSQEPGKPPTMKSLSGSEFEIEADLVLIAMGFVSPVHQGLLEDLKVGYDPRGNVNINENRMTSMPGVFSAGDVSRGASLVVWCIADGRETAKSVDRYLMGSTHLP